MSYDQFDPPFPEVARKTVRIGSTGPFLYDPNSGYHERNMLRNDGTQDDDQAAVYAPDGKVVSTGFVAIDPVSGLEVELIKRSDFITWLGYGVTARKALAIPSASELPRPPDYPGALLYYTITPATDTVPAHVGETKLFLWDSTERVWVPLGG